jgi:hypothetical protein
MIRRGMAAALCAAALLAGGCSDDPPEPKPLDPPTGSETTTAPPTSEPPKAQTPEKAIREWIQASYDAQVTGKTDDFRALGQGCKPCDKFANQVDDIYANGGWVKPPLQRVVSNKLEQNLSDAHRVYHARVTSPPWSYKARADAKVAKERGGPSTLQIEMKRIDGRWLIVHYAVLMEEGVPS